MLDALGRRYATRPSAFLCGLVEVAAFSVDVLAARAGIEAEAAAQESAESDARAQRRMRKAQRG